MFCAVCGVSHVFLAVPGAGSKSAVLQSSGAIILEPGIAICSINSRSGVWTVLQDVGEVVRWRDDVSAQQSINSQATIHCWLGASALHP